MLFAAALAALLQGTPATPADSASAFLDAGAADLLRGARERRARVERGIDLYRVTARQRIHAGVEALSRDRTLFGQEMAARIEWRRGETGHVRVLGAREANPAASRRVTVPDDLRTEAPDLAFDPDELQLNLFTFGAGSTGREERRDSASVSRRGDTTEVNISLAPIDPLRAGSEAHYRYRSGDTTTVRLPDGSQLRLIRLEIIPRRREFQLVRGSLWIDSRTYGVARSVLTTARPFDLRRDTEGDIPRVVNTFGAIRATVRYVTVEYALVQGRWWLPRLMAVDAQANLGVLAGLPVRFERSYSDYEVEASGAPRQAPVSVLAQRDTAAARVCRDEAKAAGEVCTCEGGRCTRWRVEVPDTATLLGSPDLPPPLADESARLITGEEVASLARVLTPSLGRMGDFRPELETRIADLRLLRYNRVEGLSVGARADVAWGPLSLDGEARIGVADLEPNAEIGVARETMARRLRLAGYRRLAAFDPDSRAFGIGASLNALLFGRDEADYYLASGAELTSRPVRTARWSYAWRLFAEHQHPVTRNTQFTLARAWEEAPFREVRPADRADQAGAALSLTRTFGGDRAPARLALGTVLEGQTGTFGFARGQASAGLALPSLGRFALALEGAAGSTAGEVPVQGLWYLGGPATVRGYEGALIGGEAFWRARAELGTPLPAARLVVFGDAGWAGPRGAWAWDPPLLSAGVGASFLDGLVRMDLARALREPKGWRVHLYLDAAL